MRRRLLKPRVYAVEPIHDIQAHETFSEGCACCPEIIKKKAGAHIYEIRIVHNAFDARELIERHGIN